MELRDTRSGGKLCGKAGYLTYLGSPTSMSGPLVQKDVMTASLLTQGILKDLHRTYFST